MNHIIADLKGFSKMYLRNKGAIFFTFILPVLLIVLFGAMFSGSGVNTVSLQVQNLDGGAGSLALINALNQTGVVKVVVVPSGENLDTYIANNSLTAVLQIPEGFSDAVGRRMTDPSAPMASLSLFGDPSKSTYQVSQSVVSAALDAMDFNLSKSAPVITMVTKELPSAQGFGYIDYLLPGIVGMTVMTTAFYTTTSICANYRSKGYFKMLSTTTLKKYEWLTTKFIFMAALLTVSLLTTYAIGDALFGIHASLTPMTFALIFVGAFMFVSMGVFLGTVIKDPESGMAISNVIGFPMMFLSGSFTPVDTMPAYMQSISQALPLTYLNDGFRDTMVYANDSAALVCLAIVLVIGVVLAVAGSKLMSWKEA